MNRPMNREPDVEARVRFLRTDEGGRKGPVASGYFPNHLVAPECLIGGIIEFADREWLQLGETTDAQITYLWPEEYPISFTIGDVIRIQEGEKLVGFAEITKIMNKVLECDS